MLNVAGMGRYAATVSTRYAIREIADKRTVLDVWTGEPVVIGMVPQTDLDPQGADELLAYLRRRSLRGWDMV